MAIAVGWDPGFVSSTGQAVHIGRWASFTGTAGLLLLEAIIGPRLLCVGESNVAFASYRRAILVSLVQSLSCAFGAAALLPGLENYIWSMLVAAILLYLPIYHHSYVMYKSYRNALRIFADAGKPLSDGEIDGDRISLILKEVIVHRFSCLICFSCSIFWSCIVVVWYADALVTLPHARMHTHTHTHTHSHTNMKKTPHTQVPQHGTRDIKRDVSSSRKCRVLVVVVVIVALLIVAESSRRT